MPEKFENVAISSRFGFVLEETRSGKSHDYPDAIVFEKHSFQSVCCPHENAKCKL